MFGNYRRSREDRVEIEESSSDSNSNEFDSNESNNEYIEPSNEIPQLSDTLSYIEMTTTLSNTELLQAITGLATSVNALVETSKNLIANQKEHDTRVLAIQEAVATEIATALKDTKLEVKTPGSQPHMTPSSFPSLNLSRKEDNFIAYSLWKRSVELQIQSNESYAKLAPKILVSSILASFKGVAQEMTMHIKSETIKDVNELFDVVRTAACSGAVPERAYVAFAAAQQSPVEDTTSFGNRLETLYHDAFPEEQNWSVLTLQKQYLAGLRDQGISIKVYEREDGLPATFKELKKLVIKLNSIKDRVEQNKVVNTTLKKIGHAPNVNAPLSGNVSRNRDAPVPMEVGAVGVGRGTGRGRGTPNFTPRNPGQQQFRNPPPNFRGGINASSGTRYGPPPGPAQDTVGRKANTGPPTKPLTNPQRTGIPANPNRNPNFKLGPCFSCGGEHRIQNCPKPHPPPNHFGKKFDQNQRKNVNAIGTQAETLAPYR